MPKHTTDLVCPSCEDKLATAHEYLREWFKKLKLRYRNVHVFEAWRGREAQEKYLKEGKTNAPFGKSPHNNIKDGKPYSLALDIFLIDEDGVGRFPKPFYAKVNADNELDKEPIKWGGNFKKFYDGVHFELKAR